MPYREPLGEAQLRAHDRPRDLIPAQVWDRALSALELQLAPHRRVLDIGVGSGAYGGRLAARGVDVVGIDLNETMLRSAEQRWPEMRSRLATADATYLPIRNGGVDMVLVAQVLHLITAWRDVINEARRVLRGGGVLAVSGGGGIGRSGVGQYFRSVLGDVPPLAGASSREEIAGAVAGLGGEMLEPIEVRSEAPQTLREFIDRLETNPFAWHPDVDRERLAAAADLTRADAVARGLDLDEARPTPVGIALDLFRMPNSP